jgi:hypothetical protein
MKDPMSETKITSLQKKIPTAPSLLNALHQRGFSVEINLNGPPDNWDTIRFFQEGPTELECFLIHDEEAGTLSLSIPENYPARSQDLLDHLCDLLLESTGGQVLQGEKGSALSFSEFRKSHPALKISSRASFKWAWPLFAWGLVAAGVAAYFNLPDNLHVLSMAVTGLALLSAIGLTASSLDG